MTGNNALTAHLFGDVAPTFDELVAKFTTFVFDDGQVSVADMKAHVKRFAEEVRPLVTANQVTITMDPKAIADQSETLRMLRSMTDGLDIGQMQKPNEVSSIAKSVAAIVEEEAAGGAACGWRSCTGCHETNEGYETGHYPYSEIFKCHLGFGCSECGGIGAVWEHWSEAELVAMQSE